MIRGCAGGYIDHTYRPNPVLYNKQVQTSDSSIQCCAAPNQNGLMGSAEAMNTPQIANQVFFNDAGITVPGSISDQKFKTVSRFLKEQEVHVMVLKLLGETSEGTPVIQPVTVKAKPTCTSCGRVNKATAKFCSECGTALQIV